MYRVLVFLIIVAVATASKVLYKNHKVFRITRGSPEQMELIKQLEELYDGYSLWRGPTVVSNTVDLMVSPDHLNEFVELMNDTNAKYEVYVEDVQKLIDEENPMTREAGFGWSRYHTLDEIYNWIDELGRQYSGKVQVIQGGRTYEGRTIKGVKLSFGESKKPGVFIEGGIHAREWISPATVTYLINEFLTSNNSEVRTLAEAYDWYMFPSVNPDGYVYTHRGARLWRKTMSKTSAFCRGVDANRNWGHEWMNPASGGSMDWVKSTLKIPVAYTYELRDTGKHGFVLPAEQIIPNAEEVLDSFLAMFKEAVRFGYPKTE